MLQVKPAKDRLVGFHHRTLRYKNIAASTARPYFLLQVSCSESLDYKRLQLVHQGRILQKNILLEVSSREFCVPAALSV